MPSNRFLALAALAALVALAGCGGPAASLELRELSDAELADRASGDASNLPDDLERLVTETVENGSATRSGISPPFEPSLPVAYEGKYYNVTYTVTRTEQATRYDVEVTRNPNDTSGETVAYEDLPPVDRETLAGPLARPADDESPDTMGVGAVYTDAEAAESRLVPEPDFAIVTDDGERYRVAVTGSRPIDVNTYRYEATELAADDGEYAAYLRDRHLFELSDLPTEERDIVERAIDDGYQNDDEVTPAFRSLVERFRAQRGVTEDEFEDGDYYGGQYLVEYEGTVYWAQLTLRDPVSGTP